MSDVKRQHVNPVTGEVGECRAKFKCDYGPSAPHFATAEEAQAASKKMMELRYGKIPTTANPKNTTKALQSQARAIMEVGNQDDLSHFVDISARNHYAATLELEVLRKEHYERAKRLDEISPFQNGFAVSDYSTYQEMLRDLNTDRTNALELSEALMESRYYKHAAPTASEAELEALGLRSARGAYDGAYDRFCSYVDIDEGFKFYFGAPPVQNNAVHGVNYQRKKAQWRDEVARRAAVDELAKSQPVVAAPLGLIGKSGHVIPVDGLVKTKNGTAMLEVCARDSSADEFSGLTSFERLKAAYKMNELGIPEAVVHVVHRGKDTKDYRLTLDDDYVKGVSLRAWVDKYAKNYETKIAS